MRVPIGVPGGVAWGRGVVGDGFPVEMKGKGKGAKRLGDGGVGTGKGNQQVNARLSVKTTP